MDAQLARVTQNALETFLETVERSVEGALQKFLETVSHAAEIEAVEAMLGSFRSASMEVALLRDRLRAGVPAVRRAPPS